MMEVLMQRIAIALLFAAAGFAQTGATLPAFDVASIKQTVNVQTGYGFERIVVRPGSVTMSNVRLRACIKWAYDVKDYQISGPSWIGAPFWLGGDVARFEISAKAAPDTPVAQLKLLLQSLLAERFKLVLHRETREVASLVMTLQKAKLDLPAPADPDGESRAVQSGSGFTILSSTVEQFADLMSGPLRVPVLNRTGVSGRYDFSLNLSSFAGDQNDPVSVFTSALREQLGLKLERQKAPMAMLIVDSALKTPTEN
jgi:uncharacterized protein (TIGR03435 family)